MWNKQIDFSNLWTSRCELYSKFIAKAFCKPRLCTEVVFDAGLCWVHGSQRSPNHLISSNHGTPFNFKPLTSSTISFSVRSISLSHSHIFRPKTLLCYSTATLAGGKVGPTVQCTERQIGGAPPRRLSFTARPPSVCTRIDTADRHPHGGRLLRLASLKEKFTTDSSDLTQGAQYEYSMRRVQKRSRPVHPFIRRSVYGLLAPISLCTSTTVQMLLMLGYRSRSLVGLWRPSSLKLLNYSQSSSAPAVLVIR